MPTSLRGITNKAGQDGVYRFRNLSGLLTVGFMLWSWRFVNQRASAGIDKKDAPTYAKDLEKNVTDLVESVKGGWYRAKLILRKYIPKLNGKLRPLGIPVIADKLLQTAVAKILEAIYEQDFLSFSYGYRPGTGAHKAIKDLSAILRMKRYHYIVEADIKGFFDNINHNQLLNMLMKRIDDKPLLKLIRQWLKAGIMDTDGQVKHLGTGTPQGGTISPILANIYLHYSLDIWFEEQVKAQCKGKAYICRYADDFICAFELESDAAKFYAALPERLAKYGLEIAEDKTNIIQFDKESRKRFVFLGFEFYWDKGRSGKMVLQRRTCRKKYRAALANFKDWCKKHGRLAKAELFAKLNRKLRGYWNYYGIRGNYKSLEEYFFYSMGILLKWLNRRSQMKSYKWVGFLALLKDFRVAKPRICHDF